MSLYKDNIGEKEQKALFKFLTPKRHSGTQDFLNPQTR